MGTLVAVCWDSPEGQGPCSCLLTLSFSCRCAGTLPLTRPSKDGSIASSVNASVSAGCRAPLPTLPCSLGALPGVALLLPLRPLPCTSTHGHPLPPLQVSAPGSWFWAPVWGARTGAMSPRAPRAAGAEPLRASRDCES